MSLNYKDENITSNIVQNNTSCFWAYNFLNNIEFVCIHKTQVFDIELPIRITTIPVREFKNQRTKSTESTGIIQRILVQFPTSVHIIMEISGTSKKCSTTSGICKFKLEILIPICLKIGAGRHILFFIIKIT